MLSEPHAKSGGARFLACSPSVDWTGGRAVARGHWSLRAGDRHGPPGVTPRESPGSRPTGPSHTKEKRWQTKRVRRESGSVWHGKKASTMRAKGKVGKGGRAKLPNQRNSETTCLTRTHACLHPTLGAVPRSAHKTCLSKTHAREHPW